MPCQDGGYREPTVRYKTPPKVKERLDRATRLLCSLLTPMTTEEVLELSDEMQVWWAKHQVEDMRREAAEAETKEREVAEAAAKKERKRVADKARREKNKQRKAGLAKLSPDEIKALGL